MPRNKRILDKGESSGTRLATLELLILEEEEQTIAEALMLKASIFIRLGKIDDAKLTLAYLLERFDPLTSYMQDLPQRIATLTNYYDLLSPGFKSDSLELVPMVSEYLAGGQKLQRGRVLIGDLRELYRAIDYLRLKSETLGQTELTPRVISFQAVNAHTSKLMNSRRLSVNHPIS